MCSERIHIHTCTCIIIHVQMYLTTCTKAHWTVPPTYMYMYMYTAVDQQWVYTYVYVLYMSVYTYMYVHVHVPNYTGSLAVVTSKRLFLWPQQYLHILYAVLREAWFWSDGTERIVDLHMYIQISQSRILMWLPPPGCGYLHVPEEGRGPEYSPHRQLAPAVSPWHCLWTLGKTRVHMCVCVCVCVCVCMCVWVSAQVLYLL